MRHLAFALLLCAPLAALALARGDTAPDLWGKRMDNGAELKLSQLRGKVVYVDFWATWCAPCRVSLPLINQMRNELKAQGFEVLGINVDKDEKAARKMLKELGVEYPVLRDVSEETYEWYGIQGMPAGYLLDRRGKVRMVHHGFQKSQFPGIRAEVEKVLKEEAK